MIMDIAPGRVVEIQGELYLIESVRLQVVAQQIVPLKPLLDRNEASGFENPEYHSPMFMRLEGEINDPQFRSPALKVLFPEGEAE